MSSAASSATSSATSAANGSEQQRRLLEVAYRRAELTREQLWTRYFALGGDAGLHEIDAYLHGLLPLPALQRDLLAHAVNERLDELTWRHRVPYSQTVRESKPATGPLTALVDLLQGSHLAPPDRLPAVIADAARTMGVGMLAYLVDYDQRVLVPLPVPSQADVEVLSLEGTMAGRAFRTVRTLSGEAGGQPRLWVPLLDGVERIGVLEVCLQGQADLSDPALREQCAWIGALIGHLVTVTTKYGDALDGVRRRKPRTAAAELVWQLLPPLTAGTDTFTVAAMLEPSDTVGGDAFDYALSETRAQLAIFDSTGHSLAAGLVSAAALAAYRSVRRNGGSLYSQAAAIDQIVADHFLADQRFVTAVLADLDLATGRLRYVTAGHPPPLVMRRGKVVKTLAAGRRPLFGLVTPALTIGEETLEHGDWLVLYTDGITEARDGDGNFFGRARLVDFLEREGAAGHPPPETVRRLTRAVLDHQAGVLQDDATVLLACWDRAMPEL